MIATAPTRRDDVAYYRELYDSMVVHPSWVPEVTKAADLIGKNKLSYEYVAKQCPPVPWVLIGLLHFRERGCNFRFQLLNGEAWNMRTVLTPAGYGPWSSWSDATLFGMKHWKLDQIEGWSIGRVLMETEDWNGEGYERLGLNSPYNWRGTQWAKGVGKFVEVKGKDGKFHGQYDPQMEFKDMQVGCAPVLRKLIDAGLWSEPQLAAA